MAQLRRKAKKLSCKEKKTQQEARLAHMGGKKAQQCKAKNLAKKQNDLVRRQRSELEEKYSSSAIQVQSREARAVTSKAKLGKQSGIV